jgi:ABC-type multidrug transport system ATPase subunit
VLSLSSPSGEISINGVESTSSNHKQAYVEQSDNFYSMLTVSETLETTSQLQLPARLPQERKAAYVERLITVLGLAKVGFRGLGGRV